jgi:hypothetical protein
MSAVRTWFLGVALSLSTSAQAAVDPVTEASEAYPKAYGLYVTLHQHPELSGAEVQTSAKLRTELDALPVEEKTGLPYASKVRAKDPAGREVAVGHMCGHDECAGRDRGHHGAHPRELARNARAHWAAGRRDCGGSQGDAPAGVAHASEGRRSRIALESFIALRA